MTLYKVFQQKNNLDILANNSVDLKKNYLNSDTFSYITAISPFRQGTESHLYFEQGM